MGRDQGTRKGFTRWGRQDILRAGYGEDSRMHEIFKVEEGTGVRGPSSEWGAGRLRRSGVWTVDQPVQSIYVNDAHL